MVLAQKQTQSPIEQSGTPRNKPTQPPDFWQRSPKHTLENSLFNKWCFLNWLSTYRQWISSYM
jgi:hypothetical protein